MAEHVHPTTCPYCGRLNDRQSNAYGGDLSVGPTPDALAICAECGEIAVFTATLTLRRMTNAEWLEIPADQRAKLSLARDFVRRGGPPPRPHFSRAREN